MSSLAFNDILPEDPKMYDKMRPPKKDGNPTTVYFHVTVMGLDSIDENSMVRSVTFNYFSTARLTLYRLLHLIGSVTIAILNNLL